MTKEIITPVANAARIKTLGVALQALNTTLNEQDKIIELQNETIKNLNDSLDRISAMVVEQSIFITQMRLDGSIQPTNDIPQETEVHVTGTFDHLIGDSTQPIPVDESNDESNDESIPDDNEVVDGKFVNAAYEPSNDYLVRVATAYKPILRKEIIVFGTPVEELSDFLKEHNIVVYGDIRDMTGFEFMSLEGCTEHIFDKMNEHLNHNNVQYSFKMSNMEKAAYILRIGKEDLKMIHDTFQIYFNNSKISADDISIQYTKEDNSMSRSKIKNIVNRGLSILANIHSDLDDHFNEIAPFDMRGLRKDKRVNRFLCLEMERLFDSIGIKMPVQALSNEKAFELFGSKLKFDQKIASTRMRKEIQNV